MTANVDAMVREGIRAYRGGKKSEARALLEKAVELDQYNEQAWLWLSAVVESPEEQRTCLENVLFINPDNENAKQGLQMLTPKAGGAVSAPKPAPAAPEADDPFGEASFTSSPAFGAPPVKPTNNPFATAGDDTDSEWDAPPTATSSASSSFRAPEPSRQEYDDWVAGLNLTSGGASEAAAAPASTSSGSSPFGDIGDPDEIFGKDFFDDDDFGDNSPAVASDDPFASGPFSSTAFDMPEATPAAPPRPSAGMKSPGFESASSKVKSPAAEKASALDFSGGDLFASDASFDVEMDEPDPSEYFQRIPKEIKATRLPGTSESISPALLLGLIVLLILNVGAVVLLVTNLNS
jgi:hypothetical protein